MSSTKKKEKKSSITKMGSDLFQTTLARYAQEIERLECAHSKLQYNFYTIKQQFEASHHTLEQIISHMSEGFLFVGIDGKISFFNQAASELTGYASQNIKETFFWDSFPDDIFGFSMKEALQKPGTYQRAVLTINQKQEIEVSTSHIPEKGVAIFLRSRSDQYKIETTLTQAERLQELGEMAATLAHEIRNPLSGIEGFAQLLKRDVREAPQQKMIQAILEGTRTLNHLVTNVLDYARPLHLRLVSTDVVALIREAVQLTVHLNIVICFKTKEASYFITLDRERIKLVLLNLIHNAAEAGAQRVEIELNCDGRVIVKDNGEGIAPSHLSKIFTPFFTTKARGTGLGLAEVWAVIKAHGGRIDVVSQPQQGAQFTIDFMS